MWFNHQVKETAKPDEGIFCLPQDSVEPRFDNFFSVAANALRLQAILASETAVDCRCFQLNCIFDLSDRGRPGFPE